MSKQRKRGMALVGTLAAGWLVGPGALQARADLAIIVGINRYPHIEAKRPDLRLKGAVNDAEDMAKVLHNGGFEVVELTDAQATKTAIIAELKKATGRKPDERFVFYFAGHGSDTPRCILPCDAMPLGNPERNDSVLQRTELRALIKAIPCESRTIILDACFSGGMRAVGDPTLTDRYVNLQALDGVVDKAPDDPNGGDIPLDEAQDKTAEDPKRAPIRYLCAAQGNQKSKEKNYSLDPDKENRHGVFTYHLLPYLEPGTLKTEPAGKVLRKVADGVLNDSHKEQLPLNAHVEEQETLLPPARKAVVRPGAGGGTLAGQGRLKDASLWDLFLVEKADPARVNFQIAPARSQFTVKQATEKDKTGDKYQFRPVYQAGKPGYVFVLGLDPNGLLQLIFPRRSSLSAAAYRPEMGAKAMGAWSLDAVGVQRYKVIFTEDEAVAQELLDKFFAAGADAGISQNKAKGTNVDIAADFAVFTSGFSVQGVAEDGVTPSAPPAPGGRK